MTVVRRSAGRCRALVRRLAPLVVAGSLYGVLLGYRPDYLGHLLAGYGGTLLLLSLVAARRGRRLGWEVTVITVLAIGLGVATEATVFRLAIFDPVDFVNQSLGACLAAAAVVNAEGSPRLAAGAMALGIVAIFGGFWFAFS
jgi:hypothetical protein